MIKRAYTMFMCVTLLAILPFSAKGTVWNDCYSEASPVSCETPDIILQQGTVGTSTIYTNNTSAKVSVEAPLLDYVDNDDSDVDSSSDKGSHSNFPAQQTGPDSTYDTLSEENTEATEDCVDNNSSDVDNSPDVGTHSNFENQKVQDSVYDTLTEQNTGAAGGITKAGTDTSGTGSTSPLEFSHTLVAGSNRLVLVSIGIENNGNIDVTTVTYGGQSLTKAVDGATGTTGYICVCEIWYILEANLPSNGAQTVSITLTGTPSTMEINAVCSEYTGVTQGAPEATDNTDEPLPVDDTIENTINPSTGAWVISAVGCGNVGSFTHGQGQVEILDFADASSTFAAAELRGASGETSLDSTYSTGANRMERVAASWTGVVAADNYELDLEVQFTDVIDFLPTETLCIYVGTMGAEDLNVDFWNGTGWENLATDLTARSCNKYIVSLTSANFIIRFKGGTESSDTAQDQWQIDASLLRVEGAGSKEDAVDNDISDEDSSADLGDLVNFDNMKAADSTYANLTEAATGSITFINEAEASATTGTIAQVNKPTGTAEDDFMIALLVSTIGGDTDGSTMFSAPSGWTNEHDYIQTAVSGQHVYIYWKVAGSSEPSSYDWTWTSSCGWVAQITTFRGVDTASPIHVEGTVNQETSSSPISPSVTTTADNSMIWLYDMSDGDAVPAGGGAPGGTTWIDQTEVATPGNGVGISTAYFVQASASATGNRDWTLDVSDENSGQQYALNAAPVDYQLDQEVQWTDVPYLLPNANLSIYGGTMGDEDIKVDVWNGTGWENVFNDLSTGWNNASIKDWLTTSNFTIRFKGENETGDPIWDTWQIDVALIHIWHEGGESHQLDLEVQWTNAAYTRTNEELCVKTGAFSGSENLQVKVRSGGSWVWVMNLTANQWNNVSITSYLTSNTFTVQFLGGTETGETTGDSWDIDATLLHVWNGESTWLSGWDKRVKITIDHNDVDSTLSDFPVLVYLSNSSSGRNNDDVSFIFDEVGSNGKKIAVTKSDGTTQCYVEIEKWDSAGEQAWLWVKAPSISNTSDTDLYLYYDNSHANNTNYVDDTNTGNSVNVWDSNFKMVQHMQDDTTSSIVDSTSNNNDGTKSGASQPAVVASGKIDGAQNFTSGDVAGGEYINCGNNPSLQITGYLTVEAWVTIAGSAGEYIGIGGKLDDASYNGYALVRHSDNKFKFWVGSGTLGSADSNTTYTDSNWHYVVGVVNNGNNYIYVDGTKQQDEDTSTLTDSGYWAHIGRQYYNYDQRYWKGLIDEFRISNATRSAAWIKASYESGRDDLLDFASEESEDAGEGTYDYVLRVNNTVTNSWQIRLKRYSDSNIERLGECTFYFHNSTDGTSNQIIIENGSYTKQTGPWYDLDDSETIYIAMTVEANSLGTSIVYVYLEMNALGTTTYDLSVITFEIT